MSWRKNISSLYKWVLSLGFRSRMPPTSGSLRRADLLNHLIRNVQGEHYLEIGVNTRAQPGYSRDHILAKLIHGVDPNPATEADFVMTSDVFFAEHCQLVCDVIFIDGLHLFEQTYKDIINGLRFLSGCVPGSGVISRFSSVGSSM